MQIQDKWKRKRRVRLVLNVLYGGVVMYCFRVMGTELIAHLLVAMNIVLLLILVTLEQNLTRIEATIDTMDSTVDFMKKIK